MDPTSKPTFNPTKDPTKNPTNVPTAVPSLTPTAAPTLEPSLAPTPLPSLNPTQQPTFAPYRLVSIASSMRVSGFTNTSFSISAQNAVKKALVKVLKFLGSPDQITAISAKNVANAVGKVTEVDVSFTIEVRLEGIVARTNDDNDGRRLTTEYSGSAANLTSAFKTGMSSAASSGNLTTALVTASANVTGVNITASKNATASSTVTTSTIVVEYTRPPTPVPTLVPTAMPTLVPSKLPTLPPTKLPSLAPSPQPTPIPTASDTAVVAVSFTITTSTSLTSSLEATLKATIAARFNVSVGNIRDFTVTSSRRLQTSHDGRPRELRRSLLASTWSVSFSISASLSDVGQSDTSSWSASIASSLQKASFTSTVISDLGLSDATVSSVTSFDANPTLYPTAKPTAKPTSATAPSSPSSPSSPSLPTTATSPTTTGTTSASDDDGDDDDSDDGGDSSTAAIGGAVGGGAVLLLAVLFAWQRRKGKKGRVVQSPSDEERALPQINDARSQDERQSETRSESAPQVAQLRSLLEEMETRPREGQGATEGNSPVNDGRIRRASPSELSSLASLTSSPPPPAQQQEKKSRDHW